MINNLCDEYKFNIAKFVLLILNQMNDSVHLFKLTKLSIRFVKSVRELSNNLLLHSLWGKISVILLNESQSIGHDSNLTDSLISGIRVTKQDIVFDRLVKK